MCYGTVRCPPVSLFQHGLTAANPLLHDCGLLWARGRQDIPIDFCSSGVWRTNAGSGKSGPKDQVALSTLLLYFAFALVHDSRGIEIVNFTISLELSAGTLMASAGTLYRLVPAHFYPWMRAVGHSLSAYTLPILRWHSEVRYRYCRQLL